MDLESLGTWALRTERDSREPRRESNGVILELCSRKYLRPTGQALSTGCTGVRGASHPSQAEDEEIFHL